MARFSSEDRQTIWDIAKPECRSNASPGIWAGRTPHCEGSSLMPAEPGRRLDNALICGCP